MSKQKEIEVSSACMYESYVSGASHDTHAVVSLKAHAFEEEARASRGMNNIMS